MEDAQTPRIEAATAVGDRWREMGVPFLVLHGLEGYPDRIGRDLDTLMDQGLADEALRAAAEILSRLGWQTVRPSEHWGKRLVGLMSQGEGEFHYLEFHTISALKWFVVPLVDSSEIPDARIGPFPVSVWATFVKALVLPLLAKDFDRYTVEYIDRHVEAGIRRATIQTRSQSFLGHELTESLMKALEERDPHGLINQGADLRRALLGRIPEHPFISFRESLRFLRKRLNAQLDSAGLHLVLETDQAPSLVESVARKVENVFVDIRVREDQSGQGRAPRKARTGGRQVLTIDRKEGRPSELGHVRMSVVGAENSAVPLNLSVAGEDPDHTAARISDWIVATWIEKLELQRSD